MFMLMLKQHKNVFYQRVSLNKRLKFNIPKSPNYFKKKPFVARSMYVQTENFRVSHRNGTIF